MKPERYPLIDTLRGLALINMFAYHTLWNMVYLFGCEINWFHSLGAHLWQQSGAALFIFISGFCWGLARRHVKRGLTVLACAVLIFAFTAVFDAKSVITFGILSLLGSAMLLMLPLSKILRAVPPVPGVILSFAAYFVTYNLRRGFIGIGAFSWQVPQALYANDFTAYLGLPYAGFRSADYFPLLPWLFIFTAGWFCCRHCAPFISGADILRCNVKPLSALGRHSLAAYLIHQPVIFSLLYIYYRCL